MWSNTWCSRILAILVLFVKLSDHDVDAQDCGPLKINATDIRTRIPWVATIFIQKSRTASFHFRLTGIIVGPSTVLTVFSGRYGKSKSYSIYSPESIFVIGGATSSLPVRDSHGALRQVKYVLPYTGHGSDNNEYHYIILQLKKPFDLSTPFIRSICLPPLRIPKTLRDAAASIYESKVAGFFTHRGSGTLQLAVNTLKVNTNKKECDTVYRASYNGSSSISHTFCGLLTTPKTPTCSTSGNAIFVEYGGLTILGGMTVLIPGRTVACSEKRLHFFADLYDHLPWILNAVKCSSDNFACGDRSCIPLSKVCDGMKNCRDGLDEDPTTCQIAKKNCPPGSVYRCDLLGNCLRPEQLCDGTNDCISGNDESSQMCKKSRK